MSGEGGGRPDRLMMTPASVLTKNDSGALVFCQLDLLAIGIVPSEGGLRERRLEDAKVQPLGRVRDYDNQEVAEDMSVP